MKLVKATIGLGLALYFSVPRKVEAAPAISPIAPVLCSTGWGCVLVVFVSGATLYVWHVTKDQETKTILAKPDGSIIKIQDGEYLEDSETENFGTVIPLNAKSWQAAKRECAYLFGYAKKFKVYRRKGKWYCTDKID